MILGINGITHDIYMNILKVVDISDLEYAVVNASGNIDIAFKIQPKYKFYTSELFTLVNIVNLKDGTRVVLRPSKFIDITIK